MRPEWQSAGRAYGGVELRRVVPVRAGWVWMSQGRVLRSSESTGRVGANEIEREVMTRREQERKMKAARPRQTRKMKRSKIHANWGWFTHPRQKQKQGKKEEKKAAAYSGLDFEG